VAYLALIITATVAATVAATVTATVAATVTATVTATRLYATDKSRRILHSARIDKLRQ